MAASTAEPPSREIESRFRGKGIGGRDHLVLGDGRRRDDRSLGLRHLFGPPPHPHKPAVSDKTSGKTRTKARGP